MTGSGRLTDTTDPRIAVLDEYFRIPLEFEAITPERLLELLDAAQTGNVEERS